MGARGFAASRVIWGGSPSRPQPAASAGKAMGKDAALKILGKRFAHEGLGGVVVALAVELTRADQL